MDAEASPPPASTGAGATADKRTPASGVSEFLARVFEQLSLSSWLPAAMLVGNLAVLLEMHSRRSTDVLAAVKALSSPIGVVIAMLFALVLATIVTQAFEFEAIRALEGYYDSLHGPLACFACRRIRTNEQRRSDFETTFCKARAAAFTQARTPMLQIPGPAYRQDQLNLLERVVLGLPHPAPVDEAELRTVRRIRWRDHVAADALYRLDALDARLGAYPKRHRVLPTKLGNVLRAAEDRLRLQPGENLEGYVLRHHDAVPALVRNDHHDYRTRLQMYTSLLLVFLVLAAASTALLAGFTSLWALVATAAVFVFLAWVSYQATLAAARGYGLVLLEIDRCVERGGSG